MKEHCPFCLNKIDVKEDHEEKTYRLLVQNKIHDATAV